MQVPNSSKYSDCASKNATWTANERAKLLPGGGETEEETYARYVYVISY